MLGAGEDPRYLARQLARVAVEDMGLAGPQALLPTGLTAVREAYQRLGPSEGELALPAQFVPQLATALKSNAAYAFGKETRRAVRGTGGLSPPKHTLNAPTGLMRDLGYGSGYAHDHGEAESFSGQDCSPAGVERGRFHIPAHRDAEAAARKRLARRAELRARNGEGRC